MLPAISPAQAFSLLRNIEQRSQQVASEYNSQHGLWTAIGFRIAEQHYLIPLEQTREVFPVPPQITAVPKAESWVYGIANLRGQLLPLFDLHHFIFGKPSKQTPRSRIMVINNPSLYSGVLVDEVFGLKHFSQQPEAVNSDEDNSITPFISGTLTQHDTLWKVFNFEQLASDSRFLNAAA